MITPIASKYSNVFSGLTPGEFDFESLINKLPKDRQAAAREKMLEAQLESAATRSAIGPLFQQPSLEDLGLFREQEARRAQEIGKESLKENFKYSMLANIPKQISQGFANNAAMTVLGARSAVDAMNQTLQAYPQLSFSSTSFQPQKYFG
jgi:hypothetical protein